MGFFQEILDVDVSSPSTDSEYINNITRIDSKLHNKYSPIMRIDNNLNRQLVSFQANKKRPFYRWFKYKEGFSADLVINYIGRYGLEKPRNVLDPFAGSGATLFASSDLGINSVGIELLPIGLEIIKARNLLINEFSENDFERLVFWKNKKPWLYHKELTGFNVLKITDGAYPEETRILIQKYLSCLEKEEKKIQNVLRLVLLCVLEDISFTRKDGQYLRWDQRSGRCLRARPFNKGKILQFDTAIISKLEEIIADTKENGLYELFDFQKFSVKKGDIQVIGGSCLIELPKMKENHFDLVITSPPYCNRYDYTRTYALELAMLEIDQKSLIELRQTMLSCTVENKEKKLLDLNKNWIVPIQIAQETELLQEILKYLYHKKAEKTINNNGIPRMVKGYFYEMACVVFELYRVLKKGGRIIMVNDNVRYAGVGISVDLILSNIAEKIGFSIEEISILPVKKGNSSQQMGEHGREPLRKCVYIWRK